jgi:hypothetical protein
VKCGDLARRIKRLRGFGGTWTAQSSGTTHYLESVAFVDAQNGWAVGDWGTIRRTTDGGVTWNGQISGWTGLLRAVTFVDAQNGWAVGEAGMILRYSPTAGSDERPEQLPQEIRLQAAYPNPFNPSTTIAYDLPKASHISLRVFDLLGREVVVLKDGLVEAGTHRLTFDGTSLASGIYFARLEAGEFSQTRKLMLLK